MEIIDPKAYTHLDYPYTLLITKEWKFLPECGVYPFIAQWSWKDAKMKIYKCQGESEKMQISQHKMWES